MGVLAGRTVLVTGASRGIGKAIAVKCAQNGANVAILAKTAELNAKLPGTIFTAAEEVEQAGGRCLPCVVDVRSEDQLSKAIEQTVKAFGGIDAVVNNAAAIDLSSTENITEKKFHLMMDLNAKGTFFCTKYCIPHLKKSTNGHILNIAPPLSRINNQSYFGNGLPYTVSKFSVTLYTYGLTEELRSAGIAVNALWPKKVIWTAASRLMTGGNPRLVQCYTADIMGDAAVRILTKDARTFSGNFLEDEVFLQEQGVTNFDQYTVTDSSKL